VSPNASKLKLLNSMQAVILKLAFCSVVMTFLPDGIAAGPEGLTQEHIVRSALDKAASLLREGRAKQGLSALQAVENLEPDNPWLLFYQGSAHLQLGNAHEAMRSFDRALDILAEFDNPDTQLARRIRQDRRDARRQVFTLNYQAGLAYDTNISFPGDAATGVGLITGRQDGKFASNLEFQYAPIATEDQSLILGGRSGHT